MATDFPPLKTEMSGGGHTDIERRQDDVLQRMDETQFGEQRGGWVNFLLDLFSEKSRLRPPTRRHHELKPVQTERPHFYTVKPESKQSKARFEIQVSGEKWPIEETLPIVVKEARRLIDETQSVSTQQQVTSGDINRDNLLDYIDSFSRFSQESQNIICESALEIFTNIPVEKISVQEALDLKRASQCAAWIDREDVSSSIKDKTDEFFGQISENPLVSMKSQSEFEESLTIDEAREILAEQREKLRKASEAAFGDVNEEKIREMQLAYLKLIWDDIEVTQ